MMEDFGLWWKDPKTNFRVKKEGLTQKEAEYILPQILKYRKHQKSSLILVSLPDKTTFYVYVWDGQSAKILEQNGKPVRTNKKEEIPVPYHFLLSDLE